MGAIHALVSPLTPRLRTWKSGSHYAMNVYAGMRLNCTPFYFIYLFVPAVHCRVLADAAEEERGDEGDAGDT